MGGSGAYPRYDTNYTKLGYSETVRLVYDPEMLSVSRIMETYFKYSPDPEVYESDPAYKNRIFTTTKAQQVSAQAYLARYTKAQHTKMYVDIQDASKYTFWKAEEYHQQWTFKQGQTCSTNKAKPARGTKRLRLRDVAMSHILKNHLQK